MLTFKSFGHLKHVPKSSCEGYATGGRPSTALYTLHTYLLTRWSRVLLEKLTGFQLVKKFSEFYGTRRFITAVTSAHHLFLSWARLIHFKTHYTSWRSVLILSSHLRLRLPSGLFTSRFSTKTLSTPLLSTIHATCPDHLILLDFITRTILVAVYRSFTSSLYVNAVRNDSMMDARLIVVGLGLAAITNELFDVGRSQLVRERP